MKFIKKKSKNLLYAAAALIMIFIICKALNKNTVIEGLTKKNKEKYSKKINTCNAKFDSILVKKCYDKVFAKDEDEDDGGDE